MTATPKRKRYPSDLSDEERPLIEPLERRSSILRAASALSISMSDLAMKPPKQA
jgi:hypothetical protein